MTDPVIARIKDRIARLEEDRVTYQMVTVTAVDPVASVISGLAGDVEVSEIRSRAQALPDVGDEVRVTLYGATPVYDPEGLIAAGAVGTRELDPVVSQSIIDANAAADEAAANATTALSTANGKNQVTYSPNPASGSGTRAGDIWFQRNGSGVVIGTWEWDGAAWQPRKFGDSVLDSLTVGKLTSGQIAAGVDITVGDPAGEYTLISSNGVVAYIDDPADGVPNEIARLGRTTGGRDPVTGALTWYIDPTGVANLTGLNVADDPRIMGDLFSDHLGRKGQIVAFTAFWAATGPTTDEIGMVEIAWQAKPGHVYAIHATGMIPDPSGGGDDHVVPFRLRATFDGSAPTTSSYIMGSSQVRSRFDLYPWENPSATIHGMHFESPTGSGSTVRVLLTIVRPTNATYVDIYTDDTISRRYFWAEDLGVTPGDTGQVNTGGGTRSTGSPPPPPPPTNAKVDGETIFDATWVSNFRGSGSYVDFAEAYQGYDQGYGNGNMRSFLGFPNIAAALSGASLRYIKVWLWYGHWWSYAGGYPVIHWHSNLNKVFSPVNEDAAVVYGPLLGRGAGAWIELPAAWGNAFLAGTARGIALGPGPDNGSQYYGRANGPGQAYAPKIAIGWTK